jgi:DNA-binding MarR family transcriptional regulator
VTGSPPPGHTGNLLGALSLSIADRTSDTLESVAGPSGTAAIALSALDQFLDDPTIDHLRRVLGLTPSGTVRLVDRLEEAGYVARHPGHDARTVTVRLTQAGRRAAKRVTVARGRLLERALADLDDEERETFDALLARVLVGLMRGPGATRWMCRLCDMTACGRDDGHCPVANAARERWGS